MSARDRRGPSRAGVASFTRAGDAQAARARDALAGLGWECSCVAFHGPGHPSLRDWARESFPRCEALVFVGSLGIAVRAVAPLLRSKATDPAVLVMDEAGRWVIPVLSSHIGGAGALARALAERLGATPVLTTASDARGVWSPDGWASSRGYRVANPDAVKAVSARLLEGGAVRVACDFPLRGPAPDGLLAVSPGAGADVVIGWRAPRGSGAAAPRDGAGARAGAGPLRIVVPAVHVGVGCRRGAARADLEGAVDEALAGAGADPLAVREVDTIDLKAGEPGVLEVCAARGWRLVTYGADDLRVVTGSVSHSPFVASVTGVDNVCERAALAGGGSSLLAPKRVARGVTVALALEDVEVDLSLGEMR